MLTEKKVIDIIEIVNGIHIQVKESLIIEKDGGQIAKSSNRYVLSPGDDVSSQDEKIKAIANAIWTPQIIQEYQNYLKSIRPVSV